MADIQQTVELIFRAQNQTNTAIAGIQRDLAALSGNADTSTRALSSTNDQLEKIGGNRAGIASATTALQALAGSLVIKDFIDANVAIEQFRNTLKLVTGSTEAAKKEFDFISTTSNRLGIEVRGAASAYASFAAAAKGTAAEGEGARKVFEGFATAFAALGTGSADVSGAFTQLAQGVSKGKFELEDLKSVAERLPGFFNTFASALGVTNQEFFDLISKGQIGIPELIKVAEQLKTQFGSADFGSFNNELARLKNALTAIQTEVGDAGAFKSLTKSIEAVTLTLTSSTISITLFAQGLGILVAASVSALNTINEFRKGNISLAEAQKLNIENNELFKTSFSALLNEAANSGGKIKLLTDKFLGLEDATKKTAAASNQSAVAIGAEEQAMLDAVKAAEETSKAKTKTKDVSAQLQKQYLEEQKVLIQQTKVANDYQVKLKEIASNERIKFIEAKVRLDIANVQADAQKVIAAFESINTTVTSTGDVIKGALGALSAAEGFNFLDKLKVIEKQLEIENKNREKALKLQEDLTIAQIDNLNARSKAIQSGNALVQIDGKGLQPHLEAFMWEILKTIQTRVNQDGLEMLLGT